MRRPYRGRGPEPLFAHLDLPTVEMLEAALDAWRGTLLLVSRGRRFREALRARTFRLDSAGGRL